VRANHRPSEQPKEPNSMAARRRGMINKYLPRFVNIFVTSDGDFLDWFHNCGVNFHADRLSQGLNLKNQTTFARKVFDHTLDAPKRAGAYFHVHTHFQIGKWVQCRIGANHMSQVRQLQVQPALIGNGDDLRHSPGAVRKICVFDAPSKEHISAEKRCFDGKPPIAV
jgi:hypothetical protein